jgi:hypothetical protein
MTHEDGEGAFEHLVSDLPIIDGKLVVFVLAPET